LLNARTAIASTAAGLTAAIVLISCGGEQPMTSTTTASTTSTAAGGNEGAAHVRPSHGGGFHAANAPSRQAGPSVKHILAGRVRAYVAALNDHDARRVCSMFAPGALSGFRFPHSEGSCPDSLSASIGYRDPRGLPVWRRSHLGTVDSVSTRGATGRVTATVQTLFAKGREPSVEDDLVYFTRRGGGWLIAQPDALLYRVVGAEPSPQAISPP
jgi:hypothetical protein